jgi:hypothetical protein
VQDKYRCPEFAEAIYTHLAEDFAGELACELTPFKSCNGFISCPVKPATDLCAVYCPLEMAIDVMLYPDKL